MFPKNETAESMGVKPVSLQVKQWETIHEFESEEQQKYLCFASLKNRSIRIFYSAFKSLYPAGRNIYSSLQVRVNWTENHLRC